MVARRDLKRYFHFKQHYEVIYLTFLRGGEVIAGNP